MSGDKLIIPTISKQLKIRQIMFVWPLQIIHTSDNRNSCYGCFVTSISPGINARDVTDSRLRDTYSANMINGTLCHALIGEVLSYTSESAVFQAINNQNVFPMNSVFDRYQSLAKEIGTASHYFNGFIDLDKMKQCAKRILTDTNSLLRWQPEDPRSTRERMISNINKSKNTSMLLYLTLEMLFNNYNDFNDEKDYTDLIDRIKALEPNILIPNCLRSTNSKLCATYLFQKVFPYCCAFFDGNHRHCRFLFHEYNLGRKDTTDIIDDNYIDGYIIQDVTALTPWLVNKESMLYELHHLDEASKGNVLLHTLQTHSFLIDDKDKATVPNEPYHRVLCCIQKLLRDSLITVEVGNVSGIQQQFLQCTNSNIKNKSRGDSDNPVVAWVKIKEKLRDAVARVFFPNTSNNILTEYSKGKTYFERFTTKKNYKTIFREDEKLDKFLVPVFLLLDFISNPCELLSILNLIKDGYKKDHLHSSLKHNLPHPEIWSSFKVYESMNEFTHMLIKLFQDVNSWKTIEDVPSEVDEVCNAMKPTKTLYDFKIKRCCQQYAVFCAISIAKYIGLYPYDDGMSWEINAQQRRDGCYSKYNIFNWMIYLMRLKSIIAADAPNLNENLEEISDDIISDIHEDTFTTESNKTACLPIHVIRHTVVRRFAVQFSKQVTIDGNAPPGTGIPWTYKEFLQQNCHKDFIDFYRLMLTDYKCDSHMFFQQILPGATKYKKKRKIESVELENNEDNEVRIQGRTENDTTSIKSSISTFSSTNSSIRTSIDNNKEGEASSNEALGNGIILVQPRSAVAAASIGATTHKCNSDNSANVISRDTCIQLTAEVVKDVQLVNEYLLSSWNSKEENVHLALQRIECNIKQIQSAIPRES